MIEYLLKHMCAKIVVIDEVLTKILQNKTVQFFPDRSSDATSLMIFKVRVTRETGKPYFDVAVCALHDNTQLLHSSQSH